MLRDLMDWVPGMTQGCEHMLVKGSRLEFCELMGTCWTFGGRGRGRMIVDRETGLEEVMKR